MAQGVIKVLKQHFWKWLLQRMLQLIKINPGTKNFNTFQLSDWYNSDQVKQVSQKGQIKVLKWTIKRTSISGPQKRNKKSELYTVLNICCCWWCATCELISIKGHFNGSPEVANPNNTYKECESMSTYSKVTECKNFWTVLSECEWCSTANVEEF